MPLKERPGSIDGSWLRIGYRAQVEQVAGFAEMPPVPHLFGDDLGTGFGPDLLALAFRSVPRRIGE